ncbi:MAG: nicotinate (nicotinamide) nucleotide adenylyltransferase [Arcobacteraceae bacterium]
MKIAIFGGSFDPPHIGHEVIVHEALKRLDIDVLYIVPTYLNPFKKSFFLDETVRFKLIQKLFDTEEKVKVCDYEVKQKRPVYTIETVKYLQQETKCSVVYLIIGQDNLKTLPLWSGYDELKEQVTFVVATRNNHSNEMGEVEFLQLPINIAVSSTEIRENGFLSHIPEKLKGDLKQILQKGKKTLEKRVQNIVQILDDKKAENIEIVDLKDKDYLVDCVIIATTLNGKHAAALLSVLRETLKPQNEEFLRVDEDDNWTVIDLGDIFIHLMSEEYREKYTLEEFLKELPRK